MNAAVEIIGFFAGVLAVFGAALGVGKAVGPVETAAPAEHAMDAGHDEDSASHADTGENGAEATQYPKGLMVSQAGYTFDLATATAAAGADRQVTFTIIGPEGEPVTEFDVEHEKRLHLIAVRRDFTGFQHVHPEMDENGTWIGALSLTPGQWRLFADFKATGVEAVTLGNELAVSGDYRPAPAPGETRTATVDGYTVTLDGDLTAGHDAELTLSVSKDGLPVTDLEPYLGAYGHLVALRAGDLAYLHVHPDGTPDDGTTEPGPDVVFYAEVPSPGRYQLYLDFKRGGVVRTAAFTVTAAGTGAAPSAPEPTESGEGHSDAH